MVQTAYLYHKLKDAVVGICTEGFVNIAITLTQDGEIVQQVPPTSAPLPAQGAGFLIEENYIVTTLDTISIPTFNQQTIETADGTITYTLFASKEAVNTNPLTFFAAPELGNPINFFTIKVRVNNVNGSDCTVLYTARVVGIDAARNLAVLRIDDLDAANQGLTPLTCEHPFFTWGKSQDLCIGEELVYFFNGEFASTIFAKNVDVISPLAISYLTPQVEYFVIDKCIVQTGGPVVDKHGKVVGVATNSDGCNSRVVAQHQAQYIIDAIITGIHGPLGCHLTATTLTNLGYPIVVYIQPLIGVRYKICEGNSLVVQSANVSQNLQSYIPANLPEITGNLCSICYCGTTYCLGDSKKHIQPIQLTYRAVLGDVVVLCGVNSDNVPFEIAVPLIAPNQTLLFYPINLLNDNAGLNLIAVDNLDQVFGSQASQQLFQTTIAAVAAELSFASRYI